MRLYPSQEGVPTAALRLCCLQASVNNRKTLKEAHGFSVLRAGQGEERPGLCSLPTGACAGQALQLLPLLNAHFSLNDALPSLELLADDRPPLATCTTSSSENHTRPQRTAGTGASTDPASGGGGITGK